MLISEYLRLRNVSSAVTASNTADRSSNAGSAGGNVPAVPFADELKKQLEASAPHEVSSEELSERSSVRFSKHAIDRINQRGIDLYSDDRLERLNKAVDLADEKGSDDALIFIDQTAFVVSIKNNKVITTVNTGEMTGSIFTNIDSTVIM